MKAIKKNTGTTMSRPLLSYIIVVMILSVLEFANYIIQYIPVAVFLILGFVRAFTAFKIVDHLNMVKEKISESKDRDYLLNTCKKNYSAAIFSYNALAIICCVDAIVSTVSTIRGFYGYANVFIVFLVIEHILDFVGITNLVVVHTDRLGLFLPLEEIWIFSNIAMVGLVGMACLSMVHWLFFRIPRLGFLGFVICAIVSSCYRLIYATDVERNIKKYFVENKE